MSRIKDLYQISLAERDEIPDIMSFIREYWKNDHILAMDRTFFEYEHVIDDRVTFIIAKHRENKEIHGILGYLMASRDQQKLDVWTGIWKTKPGAIPLLGMELYRNLSGIVGARTIIGVGDNPKTTGKMLRMFADQYGIWKMEHYYQLNPQIAGDYQIANISNYNEPVGAVNTDIHIEYIPSFEKFDKVIQLDQLRQSIPYKDKWYIKHRFFDHPIYRYLVYGIRKEKSTYKAVLIMREQCYMDRKALRIVDYIGERGLIAGLFTFFQTKLIQNEYEYVDFYTHGYEEDYLYNAGFCVIREEDTNIIPDYFSPFQRCNIDIWASANHSDVFICKADGDQDRPSKCGGR